MKKVWKKSLTLAACAAILFCTFCICPVAAEPDISAASAILIEAESGDVIFQRNADQKRPIASTTKIMTALAVLEKAELSDVIEIPEAAIGVEGSSIYLRAAERLTVEELLYAMLLNSANDAAAALAIGCFGSIEACADEMNRLASTLGMENSHFENPHGLDSEAHYSTARDMATLGRAALENPDFAKIVSTYKKNIPLASNEGVRVLINHNRLLKMLDGTIGIKTGFTKKSGRCLVSAAENNGVRLIAVTLSAPNDWQDHTKMYSFGFEQYKHYDVLAPEEYAKEIDVFGGDCEKLLCTNELGFGVTSSAGAPAPVYEIDLPRYITAPVNQGDTVGQIYIRQGGEIIGTLPITAQNTINKIGQPKGFLERMFSFIK